MPPGFPQGGDGVRFSHGMTNTISSTFRIASGLFAGVTIAAELTCSPGQA